MPRMPPRPRDVHDALVDARDQLRRFRLITSTDDGAARPAEETDSQIPPARTSERTSP